MTQVQDMGGRFARLSMAFAWFTHLGWYRRTRSIGMALRARREQRELSVLSDRQLTDAGVDLAAAGRGRAVAARPNPNLQHLR